MGRAVGDFLGNALGYFELTMVGYFELTMVTSFKLGRTVFGFKVGTAAFFDGEAEGIPS